MNNALYGKTMENFSNRIDVKLVSNKRDYLKWTSKPSYMSHKIFDNQLVAIRKNKVTLTLNKGIEPYFELYQVFMLNLFKYFDQKTKTIFIQKSFNTPRSKYDPVGKIFPQGGKMFNIPNFYTTDDVNK